MSRVFHEFGKLNDIFYYAMINETNKQLELDIKFTGQVYDSDFRNFDGMYLMGGEL